VNREADASPEYTPLLKMRQPAANDHFVAVEGACRLVMSAFGPKQT
jgi:hypothetical protein